MLRGTVCAVLLLLPGSLAAGPISLVSKADPAKPSGAAGGASRAVGISADGRYMVFLSKAPNLLSGVTDGNVGNDVFLLDRIAGTITLVSHAADDPSTAANGASDTADISRDSLWIVFSSDASNLVTGQIDAGGTDLYLYNRLTSATTLVSHTPASAVTATGGVGSVELIGDGARSAYINLNGGRVVFGSAARNLVTGQTDGSDNNDIFLYDRATDTNTLVSHTKNSTTTAAGGCRLFTLSDDGSWVAYESYSPLLVIGQVDLPVASYDIFLYNSATGGNILVSHTSASATTTGNESSVIPFISSDGTWVAYSSGATNLVSGQVDTNAGYDVFLYNRAIGTNTLVSHVSSSSVTAGTNSSIASSISGDGRWVAFSGFGNDLVPGAYGGVFLYDRTTGTNSLVSQSTDSLPGDSRPQVSNDGSWVVFRSTYTDLVAGQTDAWGTADLFLWQRATGSVTLVSHAANSATTASNLSLASFRSSSDAAWIALSSPATNLDNSVDDFNAVDDVFLHERATGVNTLVTYRGGEPSSSGSASAGGTRHEIWTSMSNDGRYVAFSSAAPNLVPGVTDDNDARDVFLFDRLTAASRLVSHTASSSTTAGAGTSYDAVVSADGGTVVFASDATNLVDGQVIPLSLTPHLFRYARLTGMITLVTRSISSPTTGSNAGIWTSDEVAVSGDGRWVAYTSAASDLVTGQENFSGPNIFIFDSASGQTILVSHASGSTTQSADGESHHPAISADGRFVAYYSLASNLVPNQTAPSGIFLYDRITGTTTLVSQGYTEAHAVSAAGGSVVFSSSRSDIVPGVIDTNASPDVFLWNRAIGSTLLVSRSSTAPTTTANGFSQLGDFYTSPNHNLISANGRFITFVSSATNLIPGQIDTNSRYDVFLFDSITGEIQLVSHVAGSMQTTAAARASVAPVISQDGSHVAFRSESTNMVAGQIDGNSGDDYFLYDRTTGTNTLLTHIPASEIATGNALPPSLIATNVSADAAWAAFASQASDLVPGDVNGLPDAFLHAHPLPGRDFFTLVPCRLLDTRQGGQGPALSSGIERMAVVVDTCGVPTTARSIVVNVTVTQPTGAGYLTFHPGDIAPPNTSSINFYPGQTRANNAILPLAFDGTGTLAVTPFVSGNGTVHLVVDVSGYFE